jgi:hypothetical protein
MKKQLNLSLAYSELTYNRKTHYLSSQGLNPLLLKALQPLHQARLLTPNNTLIIANKSFRILRGVLFALFVISNFTLVRIGNLDKANAYLAACSLSSIRLWTLAIYVQAYSTGNGSVSPPSPTMMERSSMLGKRSDTFSEVINVKPPSRC